MALYADSGYVAKHVSKFQNTSIDWDKMYFVFLKNTRDDNFTKCPHQLNNILCYDKFKENLSLFVKHTGGS